MKNLKTNAEIDKIKPGPKNAYYPIQDGLYLDVSPKGTKSFRVQVTRKNLKPTRALITIGRYPEMRIKDAIERANEERTKFKKQGPTIIKGRGNTFEDVARAWFNKMANSGQWGQTNATDVLGNINEACNGKGETLGFGKVEITNLTTAHISRVMDGIIARGSHSVARDFINNIKRIIISYNATASVELKAKVTLDDFAGIIENLPKKPKVKNHPFLDIHKLPQFLAHLEITSPAKRINKIATKMLLLTGVRTRNIKFMTLNEIDFDRAEWIIPGETSYGQGTKNKEDHIVPLSTQAIGLLKYLIRQRDLLPEGDPTKVTPYVFYGDKSPLYPMNSETIRRIIIRMGYGDEMTPHGFRSLFSTWATSQIETKQAPWTSESIEAYIQHVQTNKVRRIYNRYDYVESKKALAQAWANQIDEWTNLGRKELGL